MTDCELKRGGLLALPLLAVCLLWFGCSPAPTQGPDPALETIQAARILQDVRALSADEMEGRGAGTEGEARAVAYLQRRFEEIGLRPVNGSYTQPVKLVGMKRNSEASQLMIEGPEGQFPYEPEKTLTYWSTAQKETVDIEQAPLLFVGYGIQAPENSWDDFKGEDVAGKVLLFLNNDPPVTEDGRELFGGEARTYYGRWTYKFEQAMRLGAAGALIVHTTPSASYPFSVVQYGGAEESFALDMPGSGYQVDLVGWIDEESSAKIAQSMGTTLDGLFSMAASRDFRPQPTGYRVTTHIETAIRRLDTQNVMGMVEGSDPSLKNQTIVFSAHYDHIGMNPDLEGEDKIFNGAWDNAAGTAGLLSLAEAFVAMKKAPRRSLVFLACAAEESGSLGSRWFVANPPFELSRIVANFNIDMPQIFGITRDMSAIGVEMNSLGDVLREVAASRPVESPDGTRNPIEVLGDPSPASGSFYRSDQVNFAKAGIPALFLNPGKDYLQPPRVNVEEYEEEHYHQVADVVDDAWDLSGLERDLSVLFETATRVGNADQMPVWKAGNEFEDVWMKLHGKR